MVSEVTDPKLLSILNGSNVSGDEVTDPKILGQLNSSQPKSSETGSPWADAIVNVNKNLIQPFYKPIPAFESIRNLVSGGKVDNSPIGILRHGISDLIPTSPTDIGLSSIAPLEKPTVDMADYGAKAIENFVDPKSTIGTSEIIAKSLGVQPSTVEALANPELRKYMTPDLALKSQDIETDVYNSLKELPRGLSKAEIKMYQNAGITNETPTIWNKPIMGGENPITPIEHMRNSVNQFKEMATTDEMPIANKADEIINKIIKDSDFDKDKNMVLPFGKAKSYSSKLYDLAQSDNPIEAKLYNQMYQGAKAAKNSVPEIQQAGNAFSNIEDARDLLKNSFRGFGVEGREFRAEKSIFSKYKELGNVGFKQNMDQVGQILSQYPETKELADFSNKVKLMNMATDFEKAKMPSNIPIIGKLLSVIKPKPSTVMSIAARMTDSGMINPSAMLGRTVENTVPGIAGPINTLRAYRNVLQRPSITDLIKGTGGR